MNGVPKKTILISKTPTIYEVKNINIEGNVVIELSNASGRVAIDNLSWLCYQKKLSKSDKKASKTIHFYPNLTCKGTIFFKISTRIKHWKFLMSMEKRFELLNE